MPLQQISPETAGANSERAELVRSELSRVLASPGFKKSERHSRFLRFVCEAALAGEGPNLNEYLIAHRVFDRGADYSPGEDSVVRRQAFSLRQKLQEYYTTEGKNDPIRIELPVGRYVPTFKSPDTPAVHEEPTAPAEPKPFARRRQIALVLTAVLFGSGGWLAGRIGARNAPLDPVFSRIWGPLLSVSEGSVICFSNALTAGIRRTEQPFPDTNLTRGILLAGNEADQIRDQFRLAAGGYFYINPALAHAKMGEALGSISLASMFTRAGVPVRATQSRYLNWQDFRSHNLVLLGHDEANQWLDPILSKLPFKLGRTNSEKPRRIVVSNPKPGERAEYYPDYSKGRNPPAEDYALISFPSGMDRRHGLALINGVNTEGTMMALEYLTDPANLKDLESRLRNGNPKHSGAWHFQAILHSELRDGIPTGIELVTFRELP